MNAPRLLVALVLGVLAVVAAAVAGVALPLLALSRVADADADREVGLGAVLVGGVLLTYVVPLLLPPATPGRAPDAGRRPRALATRHRCRRRGRDARSGRGAAQR